MTEPAETESSPTYSQLQQQMAAMELEAIQPLVAVWNALKTACDTAKLALAGGGGTTQAQQFVINSSNNISALTQQGCTIVTALTKATTPAAP